MASVPTARFEALGIETSRVGLGCGTLVGRQSFRQAARLVETALDLGIRYFDVAPSYGMGTAEEVLGAVVGSSRDVVVATKVGIPRPAYSPLKAAVRRFSKPVLDRSRVIKAIARSFYVRSPRPQTDSPLQRAGRGFAPDTVRRGLAESLRLLRRTRIDVYLAHDPLAAELDASVVATFEALWREGLIGCFGAAITATSAPWKPFGSVWQSGWGGLAAASYPGGTSYVFHGIIRNAAKDQFGRARVKPAGLLRAALEQSPEAIFLVATSTPAKLRHLVSEVQR